MMFMKNYALLVLLSISFLNFRLRVNGQRVLNLEEPRSNIEAGLKDIKISHVSRTIKTKYGEIFDCVDVNKQHAFDHPLLKTHKIQETPNYPNGWMGSSSIKHVTYLRRRLGLHQECPYGTVPVRRNTNKESSTLLEPSRKKLSDKNQTDPVKMSAFVLVGGKTKDTRYIAARAQIVIENPECRVGETSSANIWLTDGNQQNFNMIVAGWAVNPTLYGDGHTHLSIVWEDKMDSAHDTGCYDLTCPGFVQIDRVVPVGIALPNISVPDGPKYLITLTIFQDQQTKNWWLHFGETNSFIGYWPNEIFSHFANGASRIDLGGFVEGIWGEPKPPMGSGILPNGKSEYKYVSYFSQIEYISPDNVTRTPLEDDILTYHDDSYGVEFHSSTPGKGANFLFGGPNRLNKIVNRQFEGVKDM